MNEDPDVSSVLHLVIGPDNKIYRNEDVLAHLAGLMCREECVTYVKHSLPKMAEDLLSMIVKEEYKIRYLASLAIINMTSYDQGAFLLFDTMYEDDGGMNTVPFLRIILQLALDATCSIADRCSQILANITRYEPLATRVAELLLQQLFFLYNIIDAITDDTYNSEGCDLEYLSQTVGNLTQTTVFRRFLLNYDESILNRLLSVMSKGRSTIRKRGVMSVVKNCCFDIEYHSVILGSKFNALPSILYPLAGPEEIEGDICKKLPPELQYLPLDKEREPDVENRKTLLQALYQLCATRQGRLYMRDKNTYTILRFYYMWEPDALNRSICEDIIGVLIRTEEEIGIENLAALTIPEDLETKFREMDVNHD